VKKKAVKKKSAGAGNKSADAGNKSADASLQLNEKIWPLEKDVLFRPDRFKYVRKIVQPKGCVFCEAAKSPMSFETLCVYQTKHSMVVLNKFPYNSGHILVLPKRHCADPLDLSNEEYFDLHDLLRVALLVVREAYQPGGVNMGLNLGAVAGAGIPDHIHYHLIPRWSGDLNFFPLVAETKVVIESLEMSFERLVQCFNDLNEEK